MKPCRSDYRLSAVIYTHIWQKWLFFFSFLLFALSIIQSITAILDSASNDLLSECHRRSLKKIASVPDSNEEIDDTILTWWSRTDLWNYLGRSPLNNPRHTRHTCPCCPLWTKAKMGSVFPHTPIKFLLFFLSLCIIVLAAFKPNLYFFFLFFNFISQCAGVSSVLKANSLLMFQCFATYFTKMISNI